MASNEEESLTKELEEQLETLLKDELLQDVPADPSIEEVETLIAVEQGRAYRIKIDRGPLEPLYIIVKQASTVGDIKRLIRVTLDRMQPRGKHISWKYIWRSHCLTLDGQRLLDDRAAVSHLGIRHGSVLKFARLAHEKGHHRKAWKWYRNRS